MCVLEAGGVEGREDGFVALTLVTSSEGYRCQHRKPTT